MCDRTNTIVFAFDKASPKVSAYHIHEWLYDTVNIREDDIRVIQIDGPLRHVYVKFTTMEKMSTVLNKNNGGIRFTHDTGDISTVTVEMAGMGIKRIRMTALPPEITEPQIKNVLTQYGDIKQIHEETWSQNYRFQVKSGVRIVHMCLKKHIPSHLKISGHRALISYDGQPSTCFRCGDQDHQHSDCPKRLTQGTNKTTDNTNTWANIVKQNPVTTTSSQNKPGISTNKEPLSNLNADTETIPTQKPQDNPHPTTSGQNKPEMLNTHKINKAEDPELHDEEKQTPTTNDDDDNIKSTPTTQINVAPPLQWSDLIDEQEVDTTLYEKNKKKREQGNDSQKHSVDNEDRVPTLDMTVPNQPKWTPSPQRTKKLKIDKDVTTQRKSGRYQNKN